MTDTKIHLDVDGFKAFGKKAITCKREQIAQLCWDGNPNTPITVEGRRSGSQQACQVQAREGLVCFEKGLIPIGMVHTHPKTKNVTLTPTEIDIYNDPSTTSFSGTDVVSSFLKDTGMTSDFIFCLSAEDSTACISPKNYSPLKELTRLKWDIETFNSLERSRITMLRRMRADEATVKRVIESLSEDARKLRKPTEDIIKHHSNTISFDHDEKHDPFFAISTPIICSTLERYDDRIMKWAKDYMRWDVLASQENVKSSRIKNMVNDAKMKLKYLDNASAIRKARNKFGKCPI